MAGRTWGAGLKHVLIRLEDPNDAIPLREVMLDSDNNSIEVGRASKVPTKGFLAGSGNTWFNSPVMSRHHAEIVADVDRETVSIKDTGSLHGTFVNNDARLVSNEPKELKKGDIVTFGQAIFRGSAEFLPTTAYVSSISFNHRDGSGTTTFQVPDGSDCSSDIDEYSSDQDSITEQISRAKPDSVANVIDLTGSNSGDVIDLSSPPSSPIRIEIANAPTTIIELIDEDGDEDGEDDDNSSQSEEDQDSISMPSSPTTNIIEIDDDEAMGLIAPEDDLVTFSDLDQEDQSDGESYDDYPDEEESCVESGSDDGSEHGSELDEDMDSDDNLFAGDSEEDSEDDGSKEALWGSPPPSRELPDLKWKKVMETIRNDIEIYSGYSAPSVPPAPSPAPVIISIPVETALTTVPAPKGSDSMKIGKLLNGSQDQETEMIGLPDQFYSFAPLPVACVEMGQKTGKSEFFAAREHNKALFAQTKQALAPADAEFTEPEPEPALESEPFHQAPAAWVPAAPQEITFDADSGFLQSKRTYVGILDIIEGAPNKLKRKSGDMSEATVQEEKWVAAEREETQGAAKKERIQEEENTQLKDMVEDRIQIATPVPSLPEAAPAIEEEEVSESEPDAAVTSEAEKVVQVPLHEQQRPVKRARLFRRLAEHVGMAVAGGAMVMGTLIYTAPTFA
ncbi:hypothetical protein QBC44DRAFT_365444 [Cladorrhinum sp. PSN332]|nr:hypothetical protein QBC44DRAFT_365444 [Cladorrhinum sp. PSN332]